MHRRTVTFIRDHRGMAGIAAFLSYLWTAVQDPEHNQGLWLLLTATASSVTALILLIAAGVAAFLILFSDQHRSKYYFRIFVDGTMQLQFILLILFKSFA